MFCFDLKFTLIRVVVFVSLAFGRPKLSWSNLESCLVKQRRKIVVVAATVIHVLLIHVKVKVKNKHKAP